MKKKLFFSFSLVLFVSLILFLTISKHEKIILVKKCKELSYQDTYKLHPKFFSPINIQIKFEPERAWKTSLLRSNINAKKNKEIYNSKFYDRIARTAATITLKIDENTYCNLKARIRPQGLFDDHRDGSFILPSLNVELKDGNIFGITKFYLFRPATRSYDNEIISSLIFKQSGLLALRATKAYVKYYNQRMEFIFQEDISKEFLEINNLRQGPLYEGTSKNFLRVKDQAGAYKYDFFKHRIINEQWAALSENNMKISKKGLSILNELMEKYVPNRQIYGQGLNADYREYEQKFLKTNYFKKLPVFDSLSYATRSDHSLSINDRVYYYDVLNDNFLPIHWDGMSYLVDRFNNVINNDRYNVIYTQSVKDGSKKALELINNLDKKKLAKSLTKHDVNLNEKDYKKIFQIIEKKLKNFSTLKDEEITSLQQTKLNRENLEDLNFESQNKFKFIYHNKNLIDYSVCDILSKDCYQSKLSRFDTSKLLKSNLMKDDKFFIYTSKIKENSGESKWFHTKVKKSKNKHFNNREINFFINGDVSYNINREKRLIEFTKLSTNGKVVFKNSNLNNWEIKYKNLNKSIQEKVDNLNLTGCINFIDSKLDNISLEISNANCEDGISFVRSNGTINNIKVYNSEANAFNADFSKLTFQNILIKNSKKNCLDLSFGKYNIVFANISYCGDKGISAGETAELYLNDLNIDNTWVGIVSKDLANVKITNGKIENSKYCAQAYNKKQEFYGGFISFENFKCTNYSILSKNDNLSLIKKK